MRVEISFTTLVVANPAKLTGAKGEIKNGFELLAMYKFALFLDGSFLSRKALESPCFCTIVLLDLRGIFSSFSAFVVPSIIYYLYLIYISLYCTDLSDIKKNYSINR